jgi:hypothetical protein
VTDDSTEGARLAARWAAVLMFFAGLAFAIGAALGLGEARYAIMAVAGWFCILTMVFLLAYLDALLMHAARRVLAARCQWVVTGVVTCIGLCLCVVLLGGIMPPRIVDLVVMPGILLLGLLCQVACVLLLNAVLRALRAELRARRVGDPRRDEPSAAVDRLMAHGYRRDPPSEGGG